MKMSPESTHARANRFLYEHLLHEQLNSSPRFYAMAMLISKIEVLAEVLTEVSDNEARIR
jgi:hypothetical protein